MMPCFLQKCAPHSLNDKTLNSICACLSGAYFPLPCLSINYQGCTLDTKITISLRSDAQLLRVKRNIENNVCMAII